MKIVCALSPKQVENLYKDVYKNMLNSLEADKAFNANDYMKKLFTQIVEKKDVPTAMKFLQQVPGIMRAVGVKTQFDDLDISLDALKPLATNFKNEKDGFKNVLEYFKPEMSDKDKLELLVANQFISSLPTEVENPKEIKDPFRFRPFGWLSTTFQQLIQLNPNNKLRLLSEKPDSNKNRIYNTIEKIQTKISAEQAVVTDGTLVVDGKVLKLTPVRLLDLYDTNQADIDNTTTQDIIRTKSITNRPEGVETQNRIALVLSDEEGNYYHFTEEGDFTTKEEGGKIVYQFLRNVNKNAAGEYDALNQYGYGDQIQTPEMVAEKLEITVEEAKKLQQEELKQLYEVKQAVINNQKIKPLNVVELSAGVPESLAQKKISLKNLRSLPFVNNATFKTITPVIEKGSKNAAEIELNGKMYRLNRPNLPEILIQKISSVLTNPKLSNKQKYDFVSQFLADKADLKYRRHTLLYNAGTDTLTFQYTEKTYDDGTGNTYTLLNDQLNNKYDLVYDVLRYAEGDSRKGRPFPAKMAYVQDVLTRNAYRDYNIETGELSDEYNAPYIPLLETLDSATIKISESTDPGFYNTYIKFSIPSELSMEVSETETAAEPVVQTPKEERDNVIDPENTPNPNKGGVGSLFDDEMYRKGKDAGLENITPEDIKNAETWWNNSPLSKFIDFKTMVNIVNSDVYAKFIAYGAVLNNKYGEIQISQRTSIVDVYHEAWHGFTQLFLTPTERKALYDEVAKQKGSFTLLDGTTVKFSEATYRQLEEYLGEDFRTYAKEEGVKANSPKRNTIFRKILNFLKNLFKSKTTKDKLFNELYLASKNKKNSQKFLNKYSPLVNTFNFQELNRGIEDVVEPTIDALDKQDSNLVSKSIDSFFSLRADQYSEEAGTKEATIRIFTNEKAKEKIYAEAKVDFQNKLDVAKEQLEEIQDDPAKALEIEKLQNKIRIFETALKNWGDKKSGVIAYHNENSDYKIINKKFKEIKDEEEDDITTQSQTANSKSVENSQQGETLGIKDDTQTKSLLDLASSETIVLLSSLHKIQDGKVVFNELGYPELADFASTWNNTIRAINGEKNPSKMLENIRAAAQTTYPEFKQLLRKFPGYTIEDGKIVINERNRFEVNTLTSFWQDFQKTRVTYLQTTVFDNNIAEVTKASIETMSLMRKFQAKFKSDLENDFIGRTAENVAFLKVAEVVAEFGKDGKLDSNRAYEFARAIGLYLDDLSIIKNELNLNQKAKQMYGLIYIYRNMYDMDQAMKNPKTTQETANEINEFLLDPIGKLSSGFTAGTISEKGVRQKNAIDRILGLQAKYGFDSANFAVLNAEKNLVFEHIDDHTISYITYALNKMQNLSEAWTPGSEFEYMSYLNPLINSFTTRLDIINTMFDKNDTEDGVYNWAKRSGKSLQLFINSGTQVEAIENGTNTTSLDARGKFLQELHSMLKGGMIEFMRHASKSSSFGARIDGEGGILGGVGKGEDTRLWVDTDKFATGNAYEYLVKNHMIPYIAGELERINKFKTNRDLFKTYAGYNRELADGTMAGENFTAFDNVLKKDTKEEILAAVTNPNVRFEDYIKTNPDLYKKILDEVTTYFTDQAKDLQKYYNEAKYLSPDLLDKMAVFNLGQEKAEEALISAYAVNSWVQNFETATLFYGDIVQYNHEKEEMHKRNSGATSGGLKMRTDQSIRNYLTGLNGKLSYAQAEGLETLAYTGKFNSAIIQDIVRESVYSPVIERELRKDYTERLKGKVPADKLSEEVEMRVAQDLKPYAEMEEGDGQGWITFDAYRNLKIASNQWSDIQEQLYLKVLRKEPVKYSDIIEAFPVYKLQNFGHLANTSLPVMAMHKFALAPLIPSMIKNSDLESLHKQMIKSNIQYVTFQTGSKVGSVTSEVNEKGQAVADKIYNDDEQKSLKTDIKFTPNTVYLEYLKDVTKVPVSYKNKTVFATQLRKLILSNLYRNGELTVKNQVLVKDYEDAVDAYGEFLKMELLNEIGYKFEDGKYIGNFKNFLELVQRELGRKNIPEHHIEFINMNPDNSLKTDLSFHLRADEIEKIIVSLIEKRLVRQKIKGEALVQVSSAMTNGIWDNQIQFDKADIEQVRKFMGTNNLPFYNYNKDRTSAMKVAIALQGDFVNLLNLDYKGEKVGTRERLNQAIKDDEWLNANDGANRKAITMVAVRIPVQGLNSMEYMEVYEFLDEAAGPIIIPPSEIVAKSGADFDVDKLTTFMPSLDKSGKFVESLISNERLQNLINQNKDTEEGKQMAARLLSTQKAALENKLITSLSNILSLPENYASLVRPNATYLLKDELADKLEDKVTDYDRFKNYHGEDRRLNAKGKKAISPTRVLEPLYNLHKHEANMIGKKVLGIVAIYNALHPVLNTLGAAMPKTYTYKKQKGRKSRVLLPVNKTKDGRISLSDITTVDGDLISELYSQLVNGFVDVEKNAWIFFIQGNEEMIGLMAMLFKSGVPREHAIKFLSQPLVREYAKEQRLLKSSYSDLITDNSGVPREETYVDMYTGQTVSRKISDKEVAAARVLAKFGVDKPMRFVKGNADQKALDAFIKKGNILNKEGVFDLKLLDNILNNPNNSAYKDHQIATLLHVIELEKQFSGYQELMRLSNPDTAISKTLQQVLNRNVLLDEIENDSRVEGKVVKALRKESILSTFFDNQIVQDLVEPVFPLRNSKDISNIIINLIKNNGFQIVKRFGDTEMFISDIKNNMVNSVFQNYMVGYVQSEKDLLNIPSDILAKYFTKDVFFQNTGYSFAEDLFDIINTNPELKDKYSLLSQISIPEVKDGQKILTLNNSRLLSKGNVAEQYYQNIRDLADPNVSKVADPVKNKYISDMFRVLPLIAVYQNGVGYSRFGFNEILPFEDYVAIMNNAAVDFNNQTFEDKQRYMDRVFNISMNPRNKMFKNFVSAAFVSTTPTFEKKNRFTVIPQAGVKDAKAVIKASIATQFIGFGEGIVGKDGKRSTTQIYREQAGILANTGKYSGTDVIFVSVPGLRGDAAIAKREQDKTIREAIKAIEAGATILVDNKAYTFDSKNTYNSGEKKLFQNLEAKGYNYSEITIDGVKIGTWSKSRTTQPTQPSTSVNEFDIANNLTPIEQNFKDGDGGRQMQDKFKGKSTMDLIMSGYRTRTTRAKTDVKRMIKDYNLSKIEDLVGKVIRMTDNTGRQVYTRITKVTPFTQEYQDATWQKEGWVKSVTDKHVDNYPYAIEFEVVNKSTQPSTSVKIISEDYGVVQAETNPSKEFDQQLANAIFEDVRDNAYVENGSNTAQRMWGNGLMWKGNNTKKPTGIPLKVIPAKVDYNANGKLTTVNTPYFYDPLYNDGTPVAPITNLDFLKKHIENTLGIDMSDYDVSLNNIYEEGHNLYRHTDIDESNTAKGYPVIVYVFGNDHKVRFDDNGGKRAFGQMVNPKTLTLKNGDIYAFGMGGKGRFETVHDVVASPKTNNNFPELTGADGTPTKNYTVTLTFRRAADLEPGMPITPAKLTTQPTQPSTSVEIKPEDISFKSNKLETFERAEGLEPVKGYGLTIKGQPNTELFTYRDGKEWVVLDNKSKKMLPLQNTFRGNSPTKAEVLGLLSATLTYAAAQENNRKVLEQVGFNFNQGSQAQQLLGGKQDIEGFKEFVSTQPTQPTGASLSGNRPVFDSLPSKSTTPTMLYAGIGSRETPQEILDIMPEVAKYLESLGYTLRSGKALGADAAFEKGVKSKKEIFPGNVKTGERELKIAEEIHPAWNIMLDSTRKKAIAKGNDPERSAAFVANLMARNTNQIFGKNLDTPVDFVLFYAKETDNPLRPKGGTGQAVEMARRKGIPTINLADPNWRDQLKIVLANNKAQPTQPSTSVKEGVSKLFESNPELANAVYSALGFNNLLPSKLPYKVGKIYNTQQKEIFAGIVNGEVYINKELIDKYSNKEILENQAPQLNTILKNLGVYDKLVALPKEQFIKFLVAHEQAHLDFEKEGKTFKTEAIEEAYVNAKALIEIGILKLKTFDLSNTNEAAERLERYFPTKKQYIDDITELVAKKMDNVSVLLSTMTGYKVNMFKGSLWGKKLETSSMDDFYFLQGKDGYPKNKEELKEAISKDIARNIPQSIKEKYWEDILESLPDDEKTLLSNWAYYNDYKRYTRQYGEPTFEFNEMPYPDLHKKGEKKYTNWTSFINGLFTAFDGPSRDLWFANPLLSDTEDSIINWYKNLTPEKLDEYISNLSRAMAFKSMVVASFAGGSNISSLDSGARKIEDLQKAYYEIKQRTEISSTQIESKNEQITPQQKQQAQQLYSQYLESLNKPNVNPILQGNQQEQVKKFAEYIRGKQITSQERQEKINTLNEPKFKNWFTNEATKNPDLDIFDALDYYMNCKR